MMSTCMLVPVDYVIILPAMMTVEYALGATNRDLSKMLCEGPGKKVGLSCAKLCGGPGKKAGLSCAKLCGGPGKKARLSCAKLCGGRGKKAGLSSAKLCGGSGKKARSSCAKLCGGHGNKAGLSCAKLCGGPGKKAGWISLKDTTANSPVTTISSQGVGESRFHVSTKFPDTAVRNRLSVSLQQYHCCSLLEREYIIQ